MFFQMMIQVDSINEFKVMLDFYLRLTMGLTLALCFSTGESL